MSKVKTAYPNEMNMTKIANGKAAPIAACTAVIFGSLGFMTMPTKSISGM
jgi:hypothetical protein